MQRKDVLMRISGRKFSMAILAALPVGLCAVWLFVGIAQRDLAGDMARTARDRLTLYSGSLHSALSKYSYLPHILATHPEVLRLATKGDNAYAVSRYLEEINAASGSMELFVLNMDGQAIAASNWNNNESFVGHDYRYRPYFQDAVHTGKGRYFGVGATTGKPGFFITELIRDDDKAVGVAVTKVDLAVLQREWTQGGETVFITDEHGVIFLSSRDMWRYRATTPLGSEAIAAILRQRQYGNTLPSAITVKQYQKNGVDLMDISRQTWLYTTRPLQEYGWTLWFLSPVTAMAEQAETLWFIGLGVLAMFFLLLVLVRVLMAWGRVRRAAQKTRKIRAVNRRLAEEIRIRKKTERELLAAQDDLLHAGRLAALGQVAASMVHELSQPVTSMNMFASSCRRMVQEGRYDRVPETIEHMLSMIQRIKSLIEQLKFFSRKSPVRPGPVPLCNTLDNALTVLRFKQKAAGCTVSVHCSPETVVLADALQLEQVLINLIQNALDAVGMNPDPVAEKRVSVTVKADGNMVELCVEDNGSGVAPDILDKIFTPFYTTKKSGEGLGLGLAIVDNIVHSMHGTISVCAAELHGTRFTLRLPRAAAAGQCP